MPEKMVTLRVAAGHTFHVANEFRMEMVGDTLVQVPSGVEKLQYEEGEMITLPEREAECHWRRGALRKPGEADTRPYGVGTDGGPSLPNMVSEPNTPTHQPGMVKITVQDGGSEAAA
jgi:hypothetical protein